MTCRFRQMSSWILSAAFLTGSLVSSLNLPEKDHSVSARTLHDTGGHISCSPYYGTPKLADCETVTANIQAFRRTGTGIGNNFAYNENYDEFIIRGGEEQHPDCNLHWYTPLYWRTGPYTCSCSKLGFDLQIR